MSGLPSFRLFGFPVHVRAGFLYFMVLIVFINGTERGLWLAFFLATLTLLHELGHAAAARATGAQAEIALDFLYGYASFVPTRPLKPWERAGISFAGPAVQIGVSVTAMLLLGVNPIDHESFTSTPWAFALWWAGPMIGLFNLFPVLPFDGGNIVLAGLDKISPTRARTIMTWFSLVLTCITMIWLAINPRWKTFVIFMAFPLIAQLQMLRHSSAPRVDGRLSDTEAAGWASGSTGEFRRGTSPSPWLHAHALLTGGDVDAARLALINGLSDPAPRTWADPKAATERQLGVLVGLLPAPTQTSMAGAISLSEVLLRLGEYESAARLAAEAYAHARRPELAVVVARAAAALDDRNTAVAWVRAAASGDGYDHELVEEVVGSPEFHRWHDDPEFLASVAR